MPCGIDDALALLDQLEEVRRTELTRYTKLEVGGHTFGYLWYPTRTIGLKQTLAEQLALTAERPDVFEVQFTAGWLRLDRRPPRGDRARRARRAGLRGLAADGARQAARAAG